MDKMEAGPEMDALVAERVMVWTKIDTWHGEPLAEGWNGFWDGEWIVWTERPLSDEEDQSKPWTPSTDISAAWPVVEKLQSMEITIRFHPQHRGPWKVTLFGLDGDLTFITEFADTAPLAICRAALKAMESE